MADKKPVILTNPNAPEVFADKAASVSLRGNVARISLASERSGKDPHAPETVISGYVAMPVRGFIQLYAQMQSVVKQMEASGMLSTPVAEKPKKAPARKKAAAKSKSASSGRGGGRKK